ncbi:BTB/POZ domain-containing protein 9 [Drosophila grimshawi]|uniref:BTB/POZ domain-containing protein 9 n=1 Tax=Drosophila grimshawi TaxID=7222 RepID=B4JX68_DROGR|nr:BTB/POZ domain-containing protein 9 [Drosophila grimshawi]XP_032597275.1 BTB/POZ domain-containing protein 9 [Drosophila grimshawi]EDV95344.1 GH17891 [Drosophila grimshawi]
MSSQGHHKMHGCGGGSLATLASVKSNTDSPTEYTDEIDLGDRFSADIARLCMNDRYADVEFIVEEQRLPAHRAILAARSKYFRALLYGGMSEGTQRQISLEVPLVPFKVLLRYIYSGILKLATLDEDAVIDALGMANQFGFQDLEMAISKYLRQYLALNNVCMILDAARLYNLDELTQVCLMFMDRNAADLLQHDTFKMLSRESLEEVLRRDCFFAPEVQIFLAVWKWSRYNPDVDIKTVVSFVRLPLMNLEHLLQVVRPSGILEPDKILDAIDERSTSKTLPYRAALWPEENVATAKYSSRCIQGECRSSLLDGDVTSYDMEHGYTRHCITDSNDAGIVIELGTMCMINHLRMLLWDRDSRAYSYFVEVSGNQQHWERVIDYSEYHCRSWQYLYFEARPVRFIRLVGTQNTVNRVFHVVGLEAMHTSKVPTIIDGFVAPKANVATTEMSAIVTDGVSRTRNALINGDHAHYDWDSGYTCHQLGSGEIVVRLGQPYYVGSMRLLLWDCDDRTYSFYIETSTNRKNWQMVVDKRNEKARSWQNFHFSPRPIVFIRIVGTRNTANEIFHCVHLECPTQDKNYLKKVAEQLKERNRIQSQEEAQEEQLVKENDDIASTSRAATALSLADVVFPAASSSSPPRWSLNSIAPPNTDADADADVMLLEKPGTPAAGSASTTPSTTPTPTRSPAPSAETLSTPASPQRQRDRQREREVDELAALLDLNIEAEKPLPHPAEG